MIEEIGEDLVETKFKEYECPQCKNKISVMGQVWTNQLTRESRDIISVNCDYCGCSGSVVKEYDKNQKLINEINKCKYGIGAYFIKDGDYKKKVIFNDLPSIKVFEDFLNVIKHINSQYYKECYFNIWSEKEHRLINIFRESNQNQEFLTDAIKKSRDDFKKLINNN